MNENAEFSNDMLVGAAAIAEYLFGSADPKENQQRRRRVYHLADSMKGTEKFPCFRLGASLCARKSKIREWIAEREQAA